MLTPRTLFICLALGVGLVPLLGPYISGLVVEVLVFAIFAMSLNLLIGYTGLLSLGHAAFFGVGAYSVVLLGVHLGLNGWIALVLAVIISALAATIIGFFCVRVGGITFLMLTMAFSQLLYAISIRWRDVTGGTDGMGNFVRPSVLGTSLDDRTVLYYIIAAAFLITVFALDRLVHSPLGSILIGIRENEGRMRAIGYPVQRFKLLCFAIAGAVAGLAGGLYAFFAAFVSSDTLHWSLSGDGIIMVILGGAGTVFGPAVGATLFLLLKNLVSSQFEYWLLVVGAVFILCVMFLRRGVWGYVWQRLSRLEQR